MEPHEIIKRPLVTEKHMHFAARNRQYGFEVAEKATKRQVKEAVEKLFSVKVDAVNTMVVPGKTKRRRYRYYRSPSWKKAVVTLKEGHSIDLV
jgi:large subunit ribosomal protein L23